MAGSATRRFKFEAVSEKEAEAILKRAKEAYRRWHNGVLFAYKAMDAYNKKMYQHAAQIMLTAFEPERTAVAKDALDKDVKKSFQIKGQIRAIGDFIAEHRARCMPKTRKIIKSAEETLEGGKRVYEKALVLWKKEEYKISASLMLRYFSSATLIEVAEALEAVVVDLNYLVNGLKAHVKELGKEIKKDIEGGTVLEREQMYVLWHELHLKIRQARMTYKGGRDVQSVDEVVAIELGLVHLKDMIADQLATGKLKSKAERLANNAIKIVVGVLSRIEISNTGDKRAVARYIWELLTPEKENVIGYAISAIMAEFKHDVVSLDMKYRLTA